MKKRASHTRWASTGLRLGAQYAAGKIGAAWNKYQKRKGKRVANAQPDRSNKRARTDVKGKSYKTYKKVTRRAMGNEIAKDFFQTKLRPAKATKFIKILNNVSTYRQIDNYGMQCNIGLQVAQELGGAQAWGTTWGEALFKQAASSYQTYNGIPDTFDNIYNSGNYGQQKFFIGSCTNKVRIINEQAAVVEFDLYCLIAKQTSASSMAPITLWDNGLAEIYGEQTQTTHTTIDSKPTESKEFNVTWKIACKKHYTLQPGKQMNFTWLYQANRVIDVDYFRDNFIIRGITHTIVAVARGSMVGNVLGPNIDSKVDFAPVKLVGTIERIFQSRMVNFYPRNYRFINNCSHDAVAYVMNEESGYVVEVEAGTAVGGTGGAVA